MTTMEYRINSSQCIAEDSMYAEAKMLNLFLKDVSPVSDNHLLGKNIGGLVEEVVGDLFSNLTERDQELFLKTLINPPPPNEAFMKAYQKFHNSKKKQY